MKRGCRQRKWKREGEGEEVEDAVLMVGRRGKHPEEDRDKGGQ